MPETKVAHSLIEQGAIDQLRELSRLAWTATLATLGREDGHPYASLVAMATEPDGAPLLLLSDLAEHTRNIAADDRASLLISGTSAGPDALTGPRVTLVGHVHKTCSGSARRRYLARHPGASTFIDFDDFAFFRMDVKRALLVAGFGRIVPVDGPDILLPEAEADALAPLEPGILDHMNEDHADAIALMAERLGGGSSGPWSMVGCDPEGVDLACNSQAVRLTFAARVTTADAVRQALIGLVQRARAVPAGGTPAGG